MLISIKLRTAAVLLALSSLTGCGAYVGDPYYAGNEYYPNTYYSAAYVGEPAVTNTYIAYGPPHNFRRHRDWDHWNGRRWTGHDRYHDYPSERRNNRH